MRAATLPGIFALGILPDNHPIHILRDNVAQWALDARQQIDRTNIRVLIEALADRQPQAPERDVIRYVHGADGTKQNGVEPLERLDAVVRHQRAFALVSFRSPIKVRE